MKINLKNYEEYIVAYLDKELSAKEEKELFSFLEKHPDLKEELYSFEKVKLNDTQKVEFSNKEVLLKESQEAKVGILYILKRSLPYAAAIVLGILVWNLNPKTIENKTHPINEEIASKQLPTKPIAEDFEAELVADKTSDEEVPERVIPRLIYSRPNVIPGPKDKIVVDEKFYGETKAAAYTPPNQESIKTITKTPAQIYYERMEREGSVQVKESMVKEDRLKEPKKSDLELPTKKEMPSQVTPNKQEGIVIAPKPNQKNKVVINMSRHPELKEKINRTTEKINNIFKLRDAPIIVSLGKKKILTLNL